MKVTCRQTALNCDDSSQYRTDSERDGTYPARATQMWSVSPASGTLFDASAANCRLLTRAYADWSSDGAARLGAALAYFTLFSVAPVLIVVTGVVGLFIGRAAARGQIAPWLDRFLSSEGAKATELMLTQAATPAGGIVTTVAGVITLFLHAAVAELRHSMNVVWRVQQPPSEGSGVIASVRSLLSDKLYAFLLVIGAGLLVLTSLIVNTTVTVAATYFDRWLPIPAIALQILNIVVSFGLMTTVFTLVYKMVPDAHVSWGDARGALITVSSFIVGTMAVSAFVGTAGGSSVVRHRGECAGAIGLGVLLRAGVLLRRRAYADIRHRVWRWDHPSSSLLWWLVAPEIARS